MEEAPDSPDGAYVINPTASPARAPEGNLIAVSGGAGGLTAADVQAIIDQGHLDCEHHKRGVIRLPLGSRARMVIAVADLDGTLLGLNRMPDATIFSVDVASREIAQRDLPRRTQGPIFPACRPTRR